jgi:hypothetical protein
VVRCVDLRWQSVSGLASLCRCHQRRGLWTWNRLDYHRASRCIVHAYNCPFVIFTNQRTMLFKSMHVVEYLLVAKYIKKCHMQFNAKTFWVHIAHNLYQILKVEVMYDTCPCWYPSFVNRTHRGISRNNTCENLGRSPEAAVLSFRIADQSPAVILPADCWSYWSVLFLVHASGAPRHPSIYVGGFHRSGTIDLPWVQVWGDTSPLFR